MSRVIWTLIRIPSKSGLIAAGHLMSKCFTKSSWIPQGLDDEMVRQAKSCLGSKRETIEYQGAMAPLPQRKCEPSPRAVKQGKLAKTKLGKDPVLAASSKIVKSLAAVGGREGLLRVLAGEKYDTLITNATALLFQAIYLADKSYL
jgi:hypothetical protein